MINITLPDGSQRPFEHPVTVAEVAASIGAGLAKAALESIPGPSPAGTEVMPVSSPLDAMNAAASTPRVPMVPMAFPCRGVRPLGTPARAWTLQRRVPTRLRSFLDPCRK